MTKRNNSKQDQALLLSLTALLLIIVAIFLSAWATQNSRTKYQINAVGRGIFK
jgi:glucose uptake protein GlcU